MKNTSQKLIFVHFNFVKNAISEIHLIKIVIYLVETEKYMKEDNKYMVLLDLDKKIDEAIHDAINYFEKKCPYCDGLLFTGHIRNKIHLDHFIPIAKGGQHVPWNLLPVCHTCNLRKNVKNPKLFLSSDVNEKCVTYLQNIQKKYVGQVQIDLEKFAQIKSLFSQIETPPKNAKDLITITKAIYQIVTDKPYDKDPESGDEMTNNVRELLLKYYEKSNNISSRLATTEIQAELRLLTGKDFNIKIIGKELAILGFTRKTTRVNFTTAKKWLVEGINRSTDL